MNMLKFIVLIFLFFSCEKNIFGAGQNLTFCQIEIARAAQTRGNSLPLWWYTLDVPRPSPKPRFDAVAFEKWGTSQPNELQYVVDFVRDNLQRISQHKLELELKKAFRKFLIERNSKKPLLFLVESNRREILSVRSSTWITALLRKFFPNEMGFAEYVVTYIGEQDFIGRSDLEKISSGKYDVVIADEASFIGKQISDTVTNWLVPELQSARLPPLKKLHFICPFTMNQVSAELQTIRESMDVKAYSTVVMPSVEELFESLPAVKKAAVESDEKKKINFFRMLDNRKALVYFDHKTPDYFSIPSAVFHGRVYEIAPWGLAEITTMPKVPFLRINDEIYKDRTKH